jgi:hypothetical protein
MMRPIVLLRSIVLVWGGPCLAQLGGDPQALAEFAERAGLRDVPGFVETRRACAAPAICWRAM